MPSTISGEVCGSIEQFHSRKANLDLCIKQKCCKQHSGIPAAHAPLSALTYECAKWVPCAPMVHA
jgi:hypothetical protein